MGRCVRSAWYQEGLSRGSSRRNGEYFYQVLWAILASDREQVPQTDRRSTKNDRYTMSSVVGAFRLALANDPFADTPDESVVLAQRAVAGAAAQGAELVCFPESYVPGYRWPARPLPPSDPEFLEHAWDAIAAAAAEGNIAVILERQRPDAGLLITGSADEKHGRRAGFQDKVAIHPLRGGPTRRGTGDTSFSAVR